MVFVSLLRQLLRLQAGKGKAVAAKTSHSSSSAQQQQRSKRRTRQLQHELAVGRRPAEQQAVAGDLRLGRVERALGAVDDAAAAARRRERDLGLRVEAGGRAHVRVLVRVVDEQLGCWFCFDSVVCFVVSVWR